MEITRRNFLTGAAAMGGLAAFGLAGCAPKSVQADADEADVYKRQTRYELRRLMQDFKFYPSVRTAMHSLAEEYAAGMEPQRPDTWLADAPAPRRLRKVAAEASIIDGDRPVVAIAGLRNHAGDVVDSDGAPFLEDIRGKLSFLQSRRAFQFSADYLEGAARGQADENGHFFSKLLLWDEVTGEVVLDYRGGAMRICRDEAVAVALMEPIDRTIREFALAPVSYTHLDVYKRQASGHGEPLSESSTPRCPPP